MSDRAERLIELMPAQEVDLLLVTALVNVRYLTGYTGSNGLALVGPQTRVFVTDFRYVEQAATEVRLQLRAQARPARAVRGARSPRLPAGALRLGFDDAHMTVRQHARLRELLPGEGGAGRRRWPRRASARRQGAREIERIRVASQAADAALEQLLAAGTGRAYRARARGRARAGDARVRRRPPRALSRSSRPGPHGALPHATPRDVEVKRGDMVVIDWGAEVDGYCSDCTRTIAAGEPSDEAREVYELVLAARAGRRRGGPSRRRRARGRRDRAGGDRGRRPWRALRPWARATGSGSRSTRRRGSRCAPTTSS